MTIDRNVLAKQFLAALDEDRRLRREGSTIPTPAQVLAAALPAEPLPPPQAGQLWTVKSDDPFDLPLLVALIDVDRDGGDAVLVTGEVWIASGDDVIVPSGSSPTGSALLLCCWRALRISPQQLSEYIGRIDEPLTDAAALLAHRRDLDLQLRAIATTSFDDVGPVLQWRTASRTGQPNVVSYFSGTPLLDADDPRLPVREALVEISRYLRPMPADAARRSPSLVDRAAEYLQDLRISLSALAWEPVGARVSLGKTPAPSTSPTQRAVKNFEQPFGSHSIVQSLTLTITQAGADATIGVAIDVAPSRLQSGEAVELRLVRTREAGAEPLSQHRVTLSGTHLVRRFKLTGISRKETWCVTLVSERAPEA
jgi:hypothetical protein